MMKNSSFSEKLYWELKTLIEAENNKEDECKEYLQYVKHLLFKEAHIIEHGLSVKEYRGHSGDIDYVASGLVSDESGFDCVRVYIWELKAPQCYLFQRETAERVRPSVDLIKAENQLLNYFHEQQGSIDFRTEFDVKPDNIRLGGIIIGCRKGLIKGPYTDEQKKKHYEKAITIRKKYFYELAQIRLMTWDRVLDQLASTIHTGEQRLYEKELPLYGIPTDFTASPIRST